MNVEDTIEELSTARVTDDLNVRHPLGRDEFLYDLIGINIAGLKSLGVLICDPKTYFDAALTPDWGGHFWPSLRMWLGLMTIMIGLQFIWASESSEMTAMFQMMAGSIVEGLEAGASRDGETLSIEFDKVAAGKRMFRQYIFIYPFIFIGFMCALAFIFRGWERKLPFIARVRFIFAIIVPGTVFGLFTTLGMSMLRGQAYQTVSLILFLPMIGIYWITAYRGAYAHVSKNNAVGMSLVIAILIVVTLTLAQMIAMFIALIPGIFDVIETVRPQLEALKAAKESAP